MENNGGKKYVAVKMKIQKIQATWNQTSRARKEISRVAELKYILK